MTRNTLSKVCLTTLTLAVTSSAFGQTPWNRKVEGIHVTPDPATGRSELVVYYAIEGGDTPSAPLNYGTEMLLMVNGTVISEQTFPVFVGPGGAGSGCGIQCATNQACLCCNVGGETICLCGGWIANAEPSHATLRPEDYIEVLLRPSPGAVPERDPSDDVLGQTFNDREIFWNRSIANVVVTPTPGAPDNFFDIWIEPELQAQFDGQLNLDAEIEVRVNGTSQGNWPHEFPDFIWAGCGECDTICAYFESGDPAGACGTIGGDVCGCSVDDAGGLLLTAVPAEPGDIIEVILRPAPGALPELPGFEEDDEEMAEVPGRCPEDVNGDGFITFADLLQLLAAWGPCAGCPEDINGDNEVNFADILALLARWGACDPV